MHVKKCINIININCFELTRLVSTIFLCRFVSLLPKGEVFVVFCFFLRVVMAFGGAAADTASFAIVAGEFGAKIGVVTVSYKYKTTDMQQLEQHFRQVFFLFCFLCVSAFSFYGGKYTQTTQHVLSKFCDCL